MDDMNITTSPKGWPTSVPAQPGLPTGWHVLDGSAALPIMTISQRALQHNIASLAQFCVDHGIDLAPHGKTTMSSEVIGMQLAAGAWAITAATPWQAFTMAQMGVPRIILANEVTDVGGVRCIQALMDRYQSLQLSCYVDSPAGVQAMAQHLPEQVTRPLDVLLELGHADGRTGARTIEDALRTVEALRADNRLRLIGIAGYEGTMPATDGLPLAAITAFLEQMRSTLATLDEHGWFDHLDEIVWTVGGSVYADCVVNAFSRASASRPVRCVLRSGAYVLHDNGSYQRDSSFAGRASDASIIRLMPAMELWASVLSVPEPGLVLLNFGKRDAGFDAGMPVPLRSYRDGRPLLDHLPGCMITALSDQHAFMRIEPPSDGAAPDVAPGDVIACGISHPCTSLDRWQALPLIDDAGTVLGAITTHFS